MSRPAPIREAWALIRRAHYYTLDCNEVLEVKLDAQCHWIDCNEARTRGAIGESRRLIALALAAYEAIPAKTVSRTREEMLFYIDSAQRHTDHLANTCERIHGARESVVH